MPKSYYPPTSLKEALAIPNTIFEKNAGNPMFRITLATELGLSPEANAFRALITASSGYGLTNGSYRAEKIELEQRGVDIVQGNIDAAYEALFSVELFKNFFEYFGTRGSKGIPSEEAAKDFLRKECGVPDRQMGNALNNILKDARDWHLTQVIAGTERFVPLELASKTAQENLGVKAPQSTPVEKSPIVPQPHDSPAPGDVPSRLAKSSVNLVPNLQLNIEIHIAADTSDEKIESIFKNMKKYLLTDE